MAEQFKRKIIEMDDSEEVKAGKPEEVKAGKPEEVKAGRADLMRAKAGWRSSLSEFIERPLPSDSEVESFEKKIGQDGRGNKGRDEAINDELLEIYEDAGGNIIDVKKINIKRKGRFWPVFFRTIFFLALLGGLLYAGYVYFIKNRQAQSDLLDLALNVPAETQSGQDLTYSLDYRNLAVIGLDNVKLTLTYPDNFIFSTSSIPASQNNNTWGLANLDKGGSGSIKITGKIINSDGTDNLIKARADFYMTGFSTEFEKEVSGVTRTNGLGFNADFNYSSTALVGEDNEIDVTFNNYKIPPPDMNMVVTLPDNMNLVSVSGQKNATSTAAAAAFQAVKMTDDTWAISNFDPNAASAGLAIKYNVKMKTDDQQKITLSFNSTAGNNQNYSFLEKDLMIDVIKSNLNLSLSVNGNKGDQPVNFGDTLNYAIDYSNKGDSSMKDVVIMAAVNSDFVDWNTLKDKYHAEQKRGLITWTENEIPELKDLGAGQEGEIDFSLKVSPFNQADLGKDFKIVSYAQFSVGNSEATSTGQNNQSNTITSKIDSDLTFNEQIRYFDQDNIPVGDGPLPPKVGEKTSFKVYWTLHNDLHELDNLQVTYNLPAGVSFDDKAKASIGSVTYDSANNKIVWNVGLMPLVVYSANAEFNISVTPTDNERNKIMVLSQGTAAQAIDSETQDTIIKTAKPQTTKLDDDDIASLNNDGRVQ